MAGKTARIQNYRDSTNKRILLYCPCNENLFEPEFLNVKLFYLLFLQTVKTKTLWSVGPSWDLAPQFPVGSILANTSDLLQWSVGSVRQALEKLQITKRTKRPVHICTLETRVKWPSLQLTGPWEMCLCNSKCLILKHILAKELYAISTWEYPVKLLSSDYQRMSFLIS